MLREKSCGIVPYRVEGGELRYLVVSSAVTRREHWEFPKGGVEDGEREIDTALRELREETGVVDVQLVRGFREPIHYVYRRPEGLISKQVVYFIGVVGDPTVVLREVECKDYRWANFEEARKLLRHANAKSLLERVHARITGKRAEAPQPAAAASPEAPVAAAPQAQSAQPVPAAEPAGPPRRRRRRRRRGGPGRNEPPRAAQPAAAEPAPELPPKGETPAV